MKKLVLTFLCNSSWLKKKERKQFKAHSLCRIPLAFAVEQYCILMICTYEGDTHGTGRSSAGNPSCSRHHSKATLSLRRGQHNFALHCNYLVGLYPKMVLILLLLYKKKIYIYINTFDRIRECLLLM